MTTAASQTELRAAAGADQAAARFLRALQVLLKSARLYDPDHPQVQESLKTAERELRAAQASQGGKALAFRVEAGQLVLSRNGRPAADPRGEIRALAEEFVRRGVSGVAFQPEANLGELGNFAALLAGRSPVGVKRRGTSRSPNESGGMRLPAEGIFTGNWADLLAAYSVSAIRINDNQEEQKADTAITGVLALVLNEVAGKIGPTEGYARTIEELLAALRLMAQVGGILQNVGTRRPHNTALDLRALVGSADRRAVTVVAAAVASEAASSGLALETYIERLTESAVLMFVQAEYRVGREGPRELRPLLGRIAQMVTGPAFLPSSTDAARVRLLDAKWGEETWAEHLLVRFWTEMHAGDKSAVLHGHDAWCVPVEAIRRYVEPAFDGNENSKREARAVMLAYSRCLIAEEIPARQAASSGLSEMTDVIERLWPAELPEDLVNGVVFSMVDERSPEVAGILSAVTARLAEIAFGRKQYGEFERILDALLTPPKGAQKPHMTMLAQRLLQEPRWLELVETSLENRPLDDSLVQILGRDPERLLDHLGARLAAGELPKLAPMARLVKSIGEPAVGALVTRLFDPRNQRASAAVKLLAATHPQRLMDALPQALPSWDWNLQDMAVSELVAARAAVGAGACARVFVASLEHAHPLVLPMMLDQIGLAKETNAMPLLIKIAAGHDERLKDVYVRIKAIEALGRIGPACGQEAADLLRQILRERRGLTHVEPAGLRAAAEEALGMVENWPSAARARMAQQALEKAAVSNAPPRRYLRIPLESPLPARIEGPHIMAARVRTISLGGAFLETSTGKAAAQARMNVGEAYDVEIKAGLRKIHSKAVVRNVHPTGSGVEFVHMTQEDREKLRKLVSKLMKE